MMKYIVNNAICKQMLIEVNKQTHDKHVFEGQFLYIKIILVYHNSLSLS